MRRTVTVARLKEPHRGNHMRKKKTTHLTVAQAVEVSGATSQRIYQLLEDRTLTSEGERGYRKIVVDNAWEQWLTQRERRTSRLTGRVHKKIIRHVRKLLRYPDWYPPVELKQKPKRKRSRRGSVRS